MYNLKGRIITRSFFILTKTGFIRRAVHHILHLSAHGDWDLLMVARSRSGRIECKQVFENSCITKNNEKLSIIVTDTESYLAVQMIKRVYCGCNLNNSGF